MKRKIGDRRSKPRFEIVGDLWGTVETSLSMRLANLGKGGALLASPLPLAVDSVHWVTAISGGDAYQLQVRVRHSTAITLAGGNIVYLIGVEFLKLSPDLQELIVRQVEQGNGSVSVEA